ncbi:MAG TPA: hypothetical protein VFS58_09175 [Steroidobacteraceae bacterium]|nr:hypothetical protein [Steroidobacteraceae bacterium]
MSEEADTVGTLQARLILGACEFTAERIRRGRDVAFEPECYMTAWARTQGQARLRRIAHGWRAEPSRLILRTLDSLRWLRGTGYLLVADPASATNFDNLIISWALPGDFDSQGGYSDRYFGLAARDVPRTLWFLLLVDGSPPLKLAPNVRIFCRDTLDARARCANATPIRVQGVSARDALPRPRRCSSIVAHAHAVAEAITIELRRTTIRKVLVPYEGQPFQHAAFLAAKRHDPKIETIGYMHAVLPALPTDYVFRAGAPERLLVNGTGQAEILSGQLGWPAQNVQAIPSLRYARDREPAFAGRVLLPYACDSEAIAVAFEAYVRAAPEGSMPRWEVRIHPVMAGDARHRALAQRLEAIAGRYASRMCEDPEVARQTVIFGATAAVIEALERGFEVVHICSVPLFERHSTQIWTHLEVQELAPGVYRYRLRVPGAYITFGAPREAASLLGIDAA